MRASVQDETVFRDVYRGFIDDRRVVTTNAWTNIGPQQLVKLYEMKGVSVCAVELASLSPIMLVQTSAADRRAVPHGADREPRVRPTVQPGRVTRARRASHHPRASATDHGPRRLGICRSRILACLCQPRPVPVRRRRAPTARRTDSDGRCVSRLGRPRPDRSLRRDLLARVQRLSSPEEVIGFLQQLSPDDRQRLAQSNTPLAAFADVPTWEQVMSRLQTLDVPQRMQLLAMFKRAKGDEQT